MAERVHYRELTDEQVLRIRERLEPLLSDARRQRVESVLRNRTRDILLVLENIYSDHNSAAILRTADALGLTEVHHLSDAAEIRLSRRVALGSEKWLDTVRHADVQSAFDQLRARGYAVWAAVVRGDAVSLDELPDGPLALVFGNEHRGLTEDAARRADGAFRIPMYGFADSYNISVAAALALAGTLLPRRLAGATNPLLPADAERLRVAWYARSIRAARHLLAKESLPLPVLASVSYAPDEEP